MMTRARSIQKQQTLKTPIGSVAVKYYTGVPNQISSKSSGELVHYKRQTSHDKNKVYGATDAEALAEVLAEAILIRVLARRSANFPERSA